MLISPRSHHPLSAVYTRSDSDHRYHLIADRLRSLGGSKTLIDASAAVGLTALAGQKGPDYTVCAPPYAPHGSNVLSVMTDPVSLVAYAAWEDGSGIGNATGNWAPAACSSYLKIDLNPWFAGNGTKA